LWWPLGLLIRWNGLVIGASVGRLAFLLTAHAGFLGVGITGRFFFCFSRSDKVLIDLKIAFQSFNHGHNDRHFLIIFASYE
jgi:hypothetical protein